MQSSAFILQRSVASDADLAHQESLFSLGNGRIGMRGFPPSRIPSYHPGVFINGFYETSAIPYGEDAHGFARTAQTIVDLPDCRYLTVSIDGQEVSAQTRTLDMRRGLLTEEALLANEGSEPIRLRWQTLLSMEYPSYGMVRVSVDAPQAVSVSIHSSIALPATIVQEGFDPRTAALDSRASIEILKAKSVEQAMGFDLHLKMRESGLGLYCGSRHRIPDGATASNIGHASELPSLSITASTTSLVVDKLFFYHQGEQAVVEDLRWDDLLLAQEAHYERFWQHSEVVIEGDEELNKAIHFNLFQLHQSTGRDGKTSLAAKGLTGLGYEGHYFWDTEIYAMPFFSHTEASTARSLLSWRIGHLGYAKQRAREVGEAGALYPWRTIGGMEASAYFPASTAQYHINADIAYALLQYVDVTGDWTIMEEGGWDMLVETARLWLSLGFFNPRKGGRFCIHEVTGPDEYSALVDNNLYTNVMAREHLKRTAALLSRLKEEEPMRWASLAGRLEIADEEVERLEAASEAMYIPFDETECINAQDDRFLSLEVWDSAKKGAIRHPMLLHYHPLVIYRHRLIKQADTTLAMMLLPSYFPWYLRRRNFYFYEAYTTGDSSLSAAVQAVVAFDVLDCELAMGYLRSTALMDIANLHKNTKDGLHTAAMAGSWLALIAGVGGYRLHGSTPFFRPLLPQRWSRLAFSLRFGSTTLFVDIGSEETIYHTDGGMLAIMHRSTALEVGPEALPMPTRPRCKAVIFDLDGVITATDAYHYRAWKRLCDEQGWHFDRELNQRLRGVSRQRSLSIILEHNGVTLSADEQARLAEQKNRWYRTSLSSLGPADIFAGIEQLLQQLKKRSVKIGLASASKNAPFIIERLGLGDRFDYVVDANVVGRGKPDAELFARAAEGLGVLVEECCGIEDAHSGILAIKAAGMRAVGVGSAVDAELCDVHVEHPRDLLVDDLLF